MKDGIIEICTFYHLQNWRRLSSYFGQVKENIMTIEDRSIKAHCALLCEYQTLEINFFLST
jgi:hypothetical protein